MKRHVTLIAALAWAALPGCDRGEPGRIPPPSEPPAVTVSHPVVTGGTTAFPATIRAVERADLATRISGTVVRAPVDIGSAVSRGDVVLVLDEEDVAAAIRRAEAELERARRAFERMAALQEDGAATDQELDDARARFRVAEAGLAEARARRAYTVLRAPFSGVVTARSVDPGDLTVPGRPVLSLARSGSLEAVADLPAAFEGRVVPGDTLYLVRPGTEAPLPVRVARVAPALEAASRRFRVELAVPGAQGAIPGLVPGAFVRLELTDPARSSLWVPSDALVRRGQLDGVFTVQRDTARLRWIRAGQRRGEAVEVLAGLSTREAVVRRPPPGLEDGRAVRVTREVPVDTVGPEGASPAANGTGGGAGGTGGETGSREGGA